MNTQRSPARWLFSRADSTPSCLRWKRSFLELIHFEARDSFPRARKVTKKPTVSAKYACFGRKCRSVV